MASGRRADESGEWEPVRDSWVAPEPVAQPAPAATRRGSTTPPPLDMSTARQTELMLERLAEGDYEGAVLAASAILRRDSAHADAKQCITIAAGELRRVYKARLGDYARVPRRVRLPESDPPPWLDAQMRLVISQVDGTASIDEIAGSGLLAQHDTLRILSEAYLRGLIVLS